MDAYKNSVPEFFCGQGVSTETPSQLLKRVAYHGVTIKAAKGNEGTLKVGKENVESNFFLLDASEEITIHVDSSDEVWVVGVGDYSYLIQ